MICLKLDIGLLLGYYSSSLAHRSLTDIYHEEGLSNFFTPGQKLTLCAALKDLHRLLLTAGDRRLIGHGDVHRSKVLELSHG